MFDKKSQFLGCSVSFVSQYIWHLIRLNGDSEQSKNQIVAFKLMAIHDRRHANLNKQTTPMVEFDVAPPQGVA